MEEGWVSGLALVGFAGSMARLMSESVAPHYGGAPDDFVVADHVELPWPSAQGDMAWEWRVVSLKDMFPGELLALGVRERDVGQKKTSGVEGCTYRRRIPGRPHLARGGAGARRRPACRRGGGESGRESPAAGGGVRVPDVPLAFAAVEGRPGSERTGERQEREDVIDVDAEPPPPPRWQAPLLSVGSESRHTGRVRSRRSWERGKQQARPGSWVRLPERQFPAASEVGRWARERPRCGEWDAWLRDLRACLPRALAGLVGKAPDPISGLGDGGGQGPAAAGFLALDCCRTVLRGLLGLGVRASRFYVAEVADAAHTGRSIAEGVQGGGAYSYPG